MKFLSLIGTLLCLVWMQNAAGYNYSIPNPFKPKLDIYYRLTSVQKTSINSRNIVKQYSVTDVFNIKTAISYSLHRQINHEPHLEPDSYAIIVDSPEKKIYMARNIEGRKGDLECTLDHVHRHRNIFPWEYKYYGSSYDRIIYGVGAIWLNAIDEEITSERVGNDSEYTDYNVWSMRHEDKMLEVKFSFEKPSIDIIDPRILRPIIANSRLREIEVIKQEMVDVSEDGATHFNPFQKQEIIMDTFTINPGGASVQNLTYILQSCRKSLKDHKLFPSLQAYILGRPERSAHVSYRLSRHGRMRVAQSQEIDPDYHRKMYNNEEVEETLSFKRTTFIRSVTVYGLKHRYWRNFTAATPHEGHATKYYHYIDGTSLVPCKQEHEPSERLSILNRWLHFYHGPQQEKTWGQFSGLFALLMNAGKFKHYEHGKESLRISRPGSDGYTKDCITMIIREDDELSGSRISVKFYLYNSYWSDHLLIENLERVEIYEEVKSEKSLLLVYESVHFFDEFTARERLQLPLECASLPDKADDETGNGNGEDFERPDLEPTWDDDVDDHGEADDFEFSPGRLTEDNFFPRITDILGTRNAWHFESTVSLKSDRQRKLIMHDSFLIDQSLARLRIAYMFEDGTEPPELPRTYWIDYKSEAIYKLYQDDLYCKPSFEVDSEMRLFSTRTQFHASHQNARVMIDNSEMRQYGLSALWLQASESPNVDFKGNMSEVKNDKGGKYQLFGWEMKHHGDDDGMIIQYIFRFNRTMAEQYRDSLKDKERLVREPHEFYKLDSIILDPYETFEQLIITPTTISFEQDPTIEPPRNCMDLIETLRQDFDARLKSKLEPLGSLAEDGGKHFAKIRLEYKDPSRIIRREITELYDPIIKSGQVEMVDIEYKEDGSFSQTNHVEFYVNGKNQLFRHYPRPRICHQVDSMDLMFGPFGEFLRSLSEDIKLETVSVLAAVYHSIPPDSTKLTISSGLDRNNLPVEIYDHYAHVPLRDGSMVRVRVTLHGEPERNPQVLEISGIEMEKNPDDWSELTVNSIGFVHNINYTLPEPCKHPSDPGSSPAPEPSPTIQPDPPTTEPTTNQPTTTKPVEREFFKIQNVMKSGMTLHFRSHIFSSEPTVKGYQTFQVDEWYYDGLYRIQTTPKQIDVLVNSRSNEIFDLTDEFICKSEPAKLYKASRTSESKILDLWNHQDVKIDKLLDLYYAPMATWMLASKTSSSIKFKGLEKDHDDPRLQIDQVWQLSEPEWQAEFFFEGNTLDDTILKKILINDSGTRSVTAIRIIYDSLSIEEPSSVFLLPTGYGCKRSTDPQGKFDEFVGDLKEHTNFEYTATLEVDQRKCEPISGNFISTGRKESSSFEILAYSTRSMYQNGSSSSKRHVVDVPNSIKYTIDLNNGECDISKKVKRWLLFSECKGIKGIQIDAEAFDVLFRNTKSGNFSLLNRYRIGSQYVSVYEKTLSGYRPTDSDQIFGDTVSIVRTFIHPNDESNDKGSIPRHAVDMDYWTFEPSRSKVKAKLSISIRATSRDNFDESLRQFDISPCDQSKRFGHRKIRVFSIKYKGSTNAEIHRAFVDKLTQQASLLVTQINSLRIMQDSSAAERSQLVFEFSLIDPPTAINLFNTFLDYKMNEELISRSPFKVTPNLLGCSQWCDQMGCDALSYCPNNHSCTITTLEMLNEGDGKIISLADLEYKRSSAKGCSYYSARATRPKTVEQAALLLDAIINDHLISHGDMSLVDGGEILEPVEFVQLDGAFGDSQSGPSDRGDNPFRTVKINAILKETNEVEHEKSLEQCIESCRERKCKALSYCLNTGECYRTDDKADLHQLLTDGIIENESCNVLTPDLLTGYKKFPAVLEPKEWVKKLNGYSEVECAAACGSPEEESDIGCLSFDLCIEDKQNVCYLQKTHVATGTVDLQRPDKRSTVRCKHYSKNILARFHQIGSKEIVDSTLQAKEVHSTEDCASDCMEHDCWGFQICYDGSKQTCTLINGNQNVTHKQWIQDLEDKSKKSLKCSIYTKKLEDSSLPEVSHTTSNILISITISIVAGLGFGVALRILSPIVRKYL